MRTIQELIAQDIPRDHMTEEEERAFVDHWFNEYEKTSFLDTFKTPYDQYTDRNGQHFEVLGRCTEDKFDLECLPVWNIRFEDGFETEAFPEEICKLEHLPKAADAHAAAQHWKHRAEKLLKAKTYIDMDESELALVVKYETEKYKPMVDDLKEQGFSTGMIADRLHDLWADYQLADDAETNLLAYARSCFDDFGIREIAYELYKQNWVDGNTAPQTRLEALREYFMYRQECVAEGDEIDPFDEWIWEQGYRGSLYACFEEFCDEEYRDTDFIESLLSDKALIEQYHQDLAEDEDDDED